MSWYEIALNGTGKRALQHFEYEVYVLYHDMNSLNLTVEIWQ